MLPSYGDESRYDFETADDRARNDHALTVAITLLFDALQAWDSQDAGPIDLELRDVYSSSDHPFPRMSDPSRNPDKALSLVKRDENRELVDLWSFRFYYSYISLTEGHAAPILSAIRSFSVAHPTTRHLADPVATRGMFRLETLEVRGVIDGSLFVPPCQALAESSWSGLQHLRVFFHNRKPQGGHYFEHPELASLPVPSENDRPPGYSSADGTDASTISPDQLDPFHYHGVLPRLR